MSEAPFAVLGSGMMTGVGLTTPTACAAIRCAIDNFQETRFLGDGGEWLLGCEVLLEPPMRGESKLVKMLADALRQCVEQLPPGVSADQVPLLLNLAEADRPGRFELDESVLGQLADELGFAFHEDSRVLAQGRVGCAVALHWARTLLHREADRHDRVIVAGVDSLLVGPTLASFIERDRILTAKNSDGFIPGEAAAAVLLGRPTAVPGGTLICTGMGFARETATIESEQPQRGDGLVKAITAALEEAGRDMAQMDLRVTDNSGEQYGFKDTALAVLRILRERKDEFDIWHPADCIGEVGAATLPCLLGVASTAAQDDYLPGPNVLFHVANDDGKRAALVMQNYRGR